MDEETKSTLATVGSVAGVLLALVGAAVAVAAYVFGIADDVEDVKDTLAGWETGATVLPMEERILKHMDETVANVDARMDATDVVVAQHRERTSDQVNAAYVAIAEHEHD